MGVDLSEPMLARLNERIRRAGRRIKGQPTLLRADMRELPLRGPFELVICPFNAFMHLYLFPDISACLTEVRRLLHPTRGRFVFDVLNPDLRWLLRDPRKRWARTKFKHPVTGDPMIYSTNHVYDGKRQIAHIKIYYECPDNPALERTVTLSHRQFFPQELRLLLSIHGLQVVREHGDFQGGPFEADSDSQLLICHPME